MYEKLKQAIEETKMVDAHCHVGICIASEERECDDSVRPKFKDVFQLPKDSATTGLYYLEQLHYEAYEKLYGFTKDKIDNPEYRSEIEKIYQEKRRDTNTIVNQVVELAGLDYIIGNMIMPESLTNNPKVGFIPRIDPLLYPFNNTAMIAMKNSLTVKVAELEWELKQLRRALKMSDDIPERYEDYLSFVDTALDYYKQQGCPAYKIISAYVRSTLFTCENPDGAQADYEQAQRGDLESYLRFQNRVVWHIMERVAKDGTPIQFHMALSDPHIEDFNPLNLTVFLKDARTAKAKIVILHGGYPHFDETTVAALTTVTNTKNNVYIDISGRIMFSGHPRIIADMLYKWLIYPSLWEKITYGSDMIYNERYLYTCAKTGRQAVYYAMERMIDNEIVSEEKAIEIAKGILRNNAIRLYGLDFPIT